MAIRGILYDEEGRVVGRTEEKPEDFRPVSAFQKRIHETVRQVSAGEVHFQNKGTRRRPVNLAFSRHLNEEW